MDIRKSLEGRKEFFYFYLLRAKIYTRQIESLLSVYGKALENLYFCRVSPTDTRQSNAFPSALFPALCKYYVCRVYCICCAFFSLLSAKSFVRRVPDGLLSTKLQALSKQLVSRSASPLCHFLYFIACAPGTGGHNRTGWEATKSDEVGKKGFSWRKIPMQ